MTTSIYFLNIKSRKLKDLKNRERGGDHHGAALPRVSPVRSARVTTGAVGQALTHKLLTTSIGRGDNSTNCLATVVSLQVRIVLIDQVLSHIE